MGNNNLFDGEICQVGPHRLTVRWLQGNIQAHCLERDHQIGDKITVVVPADKLTTVSQPPDQNSLKAILRGREFMGSQVSYWLETETGRVIKMIRQEAFSDSLTIPINSEMTLFWEVEEYRNSRRANPSGRVTQSPVLYRAKPDDIQKPKFMACLPTSTFRKNSQVIQYDRLAMGVSSLLPQNCYLLHREFYQALCSKSERLQPPLGGCRILTPQGFRTRF